MEKSMDTRERRIVGTDELDCVFWEIRNGMLQKWIRPNWCFRRIIEELFFERTTLKDAIRLDVIDIRVLHEDSGLIFSASMVDFLRYGRNGRRHSVQVIRLPLEFWRIESMNNPGEYIEQLKLFEF